MKQNSIKFWSLVKLISSYILKDYRLVKICFIVLTCDLLYEEIHVWLVRKPTLTSVTTSNIRPETFPDILLCPEQAFDLHSLNKIGYKFSFYYGVGYISNDRLKTGWLGNQTDMNITEVVNKISNVKTVDDCPEVVAKFNDGGRLKDTPLRLNLSKVIYPFHGRCCRVIKPKEADKNVVSYIYSRMKLYFFLAKNPRTRIL